MKKQLVAVAIPIYKVMPDDYETIALKQCQEVLGAYPIVFFAPESMDTRYYQEACPAAEIMRFDDTYFRSVSGYSRLLLSTFFYDAFAAYEYMLIYQLDAFVFSDTLKEWCAKGYDYIGARWIDTDFLEYWQNHSNARRRFVKYRLARFFPKIAERQQTDVGNGGLSLRKISSFRFFARYLKPFADRFEAEEDTFWCYFATSTIPALRVAGQADAVKFSFETEPIQAFELNGRQLPFGCHAWEKHDIGFWRPIFQTFGHTI